jgi:hypothetical protein
MGLFSRKKEEESLPAVPSLQQVNPSGVQQSVIPSISGSSDLNQCSMGIPSSNFSDISQDITSSCSLNKNEPFFVRIDRFNDAKKNLFEIEKKLREMENVLVKIGETKQKEDEEIDSWKQDMKIIRSYLEDINQSVFSKL